MEEEVRICDCCERCFDEFEDEIEDYSYKPTPIFYGQGKRYFGRQLP